MRDKLGLFGLDDKDKFLILDLLTWMHEKKADYTNTFCHLMNLAPRKDELFNCLLYTSPSPRDGLLSRMPSSA